MAASLHQLYQEHGIDVPEIVFADLTEQVKNEYGLGYIASRFIDGTALQRGDSLHERLAFENLAKIHQITPEEVTSLELPGISIDSTGKPIPLEELRPVERWYRTDVAGTQELLQGPLRGLRTADAQRAGSFCDEAEARMQKFGLARVVLHGDYNGNNLIFEPDSRSYTIDLDSIRAGPFRVELGTALLRVLYGSTSRKLDTIDIERLLDDPRLRTAEDAYYSIAPEGSRNFWNEHREAVLLSAYLWTVWLLAYRSRKADRYSRGRRMRYRRQAFKRWKRVLQYLDRG